MLEPSSSNTFEPQVGDFPNRQTSSRRGIGDRVKTRFQVEFPWLGKCATDSQLSARCFLKCGALDGWEGVQQGLAMCSRSYSLSTSWPSLGLV